MPEKSSVPRFAFFGTDAFSVGVLEALAARGLPPALVVTAPDRPAGRGLALTEPAAKVWAKARGVALLQPEKLDEAFAAALASAGPWDCFAVASYGKIVPRSVLEVPRCGSLNVHPSLLPRHRGAAPIEATVLADERETGVTVILMDEKMDHGPILGRAGISFDEWPTRPEIEAKLATVGGELLAELLPKWIAGKIEATPQDESAATYTKKLERQDGDLSLAKTEREKFLRVQAMSPWPSAFFTVEHGGKMVRVKVTAARWDAENQRCVFGRVTPEGHGEMDYASFQNGFLK
ncbi:MAG TPA: methionyl-tRNA formyltransferase [Candidatus Paceibacterota bacterium]